MLPDERFFTGDFASWTVYFVNICMKNQHTQQLFIQFIIMYGSSYTVYVLLGISPGTGIYKYHTLLSLFIFYIQPLKMILTEGSETSANHNLTPGKYPK
jgi:hypothetical protein